MSDDSVKLLDRMTSFWQPRASRKLSSEDACQMTERVVDFLKILAEWEAKAGTTQPSPRDTHAP